MTIEEIIKNIESATTNFIQIEQAILKRNLSERLLSARFASYLSPSFDKYHVDPEYNGDIDKPNDRKALRIAKNEIYRVRHKFNHSDTYKITPDIIVHIRGTNSDNLVVIEVKKDISSETEKTFDLIKLKHLTMDYLGNHYNYKVGVAIIFGTSNNTGNVQKVYFHNGRPIDKK